MADLIAIMDKAQNLIRDPARWTQGEFHEIRDGVDCYCSLGAIEVFTQTDLITYHKIRRLLGDVVRELDGELTGIAMYNDIHTHEEVMAVWDKAKELAREQAA